MKKLKIKSGVVYLDNEKVECVRSYKLVSAAENKGIAELTLTMNVITAEIAEKEEKGM